MKNKLIVTLTTVKGSKQYSLGQVARFVVAFFILVSAASFFVSNWLLVKASDDLAILEQDHQVLADQYEMMLGTQTLYKNELDDLSASLSKVANERDKLQEENSRIGELQINLGESLQELETLLNIPDNGDLTAERLESLTMMANQRLFMLNSIPNGLPIQAIRVNDDFGMRFHPIRKQQVLHKGIDYKAEIGTPVYATADGIIEFAGNKGDGYGRQIVMLHNYGFRSAYAHMNELDVSAGEYVHKGQKIGESGNTGKSTGPHLHYEVRYLYTPINPAPFVAWNIANFDSLFQQVKSVKWASLKNLYPLNQTALQ